MYSITYYSRAGRVVWLNDLNAEEALFIAKCISDAGYMVDIYQGMSKRAHFSNGKRHAPHGKLSPAPSDVCSTDGFYDNVAEVDQPLPVVAPLDYPKVN